MAIIDSLIDTNCWTFSSFNVYLFISLLLLLLTTKYCMCLETVQFYKVLQKYDVYNNYTGSIASVYPALA